MLMTALWGVVALASAFVIVHLFNIVRYQDTEVAAAATTHNFPAITLGATTSGIVIATDLWMAVLGATFMAPDVLISTGLAVLGYVSISGLVSIQPETWALVTIASLTGIILLR